MLNSHFTSGYCYNGFMMYSKWVFGMKPMYGDDSYILVLLTNLSHSALTSDTSNINRSWDLRWNSHLDNNLVETFSNSSNSWNSFPSSVSQCQWCPTGPMILPGYQTSDSASSSKFHHVALLGALMSHGSSPLALACLACGTSVTFDISVTQ